MFNFLKKKKAKPSIPEEKVYPPANSMPPHLKAHIEHLRSQRLFQVSETDKAVLVRFLVEFTTAGVFVSESEEMTRKMILGGLGNQARRLFGETGLYVHSPPSGKLPFFACMACMESNPTDPAFYSSALVVCWFQDELPRDVHQTIAEKVYGIDWKTYAKDGEP